MAIDAYALGSGHPDLVLHGGTVVTLDDQSSRHQAIAITAGRVSALGDSRDLLAAAGDALLVDLRGGTVVPGFIETHTHPVALGQRLANDFDPSSPLNATIAEVVERLEAAVAATEPGEWVVGWGYDDTALADLRHPTRADLDPVSPDHPVVLHHASGHFAAVNTAALRLMGVDRNTADPEGGHLDRDSEGMPTGVLAEAAAMAVYDFLPQLDQESEAQMLGRAGAEFAAHGITTVHDAALAHRGPGTLDSYAAAMSSGRLATRVRGYLHHSSLRFWGDPSTLTPGDLPDLHPHMRVRGVKMWADGSIQGETGYLTEDYRCHPGHCGAPALGAGDLRGNVRSLHDRGWQLATHANGDAAIDLVLEAYGDLSGDIASSRHRIEHAQMARPDQLDAMARLGVLPSFFAKHVRYWGDRHRDRFLGESRATAISPLASAAGRGIRFALHSDAPITPVSPLEGIAIAVTRRTSSGQVLGDRERIDGEAALRAYTSDAARFGFDEHELGVIGVGRPADLAVLSADPTTVAPHQLGELTVHATYLAGTQVYDHQKKRNQ